MKERRQYSVSDAMNDLHRIIEEVESGVTVELTEEGRPVAVLLSNAAYYQYQHLIDVRPELKRRLLT